MKASTMNIERAYQLIAPLLKASCPDQEFDANLPLMAQGLTSLAAARILLELKIKLGVKVRIGQFAEGLTLNDIAVAVAQNGVCAQDQAVGASSPALPRAASGAIPLLPLQQAYLVTSSTGFVDDPVGCHIYREFEIEGFEAEEIEAAWKKVCAAQPMLSARITDDGAYAPGPPPEIEIFRTSGEQYGELISSQRAQLEFRCGRAPNALLKVAVVARPRRATVILSADGLIVDGQGLTTLLSQWSRLLKEPNAPPRQPALSYAECVEQVNAAATAEDHRYWESLLRDAPAPLFHTAASSNGDGSLRYRGSKEGPLPRRTLAYRLPASQWSACEALAREWGITSTSLVFAVFCEVLLGFQRRPAASFMMTTNARRFLPQAAQHLVGSFTSSMVVPVTHAGSDSFADFAIRLNKELWRHQEHSAAQAVSVLRRVVRAEPAENFSQVVFTSLLGGELAGEPNVFQEAHCASQTCSVLLDHQMERCGDSVIFRWFVVDRKLPPFAADICFARMINILTGLARQHRPGKGLNSLQQSYWVQQKTAGHELCCNAVFSAEVPRLDTERLAEIWRSRLSAVPALRSRVEADGSVSVVEPPIADYYAGIIDVATEDFDGVRRALDHALGEQRYALGIWPMHACFVLRSPAGRSSLHFTFDLTFLDGKSIHGIVSEILTALASPSTSPKPAFFAGSQPPTESSAPRLAESGTATAYWTAKSAALPSGPVPYPNGADSWPWRRIERRLQHGRQLRDQCRQKGLDPDVVCIAAFAHAWGLELNHPFTLPLVWWSDQDDGQRPGEASQMSWLAVDDGLLDPGAPLAPAKFHAFVAAVARTLDEDFRHGGIEGLRPLSQRHRSATPEKANAGFSLPVVYTKSVEWLDLPEAISSTLRWETRTPGILLDAVSLWVNDTLIVAFDYLPAGFADGQIERVFERFTAILRKLVDMEPGWLDPVSSSAGQARDGGRDLSRQGSSVSVPPSCLEPVHLEFERVVRAAPHADALIWKQGSWSYSQLNARANRIARFLRERGVAENTKVAICMRRGPEMVAAGWGILKAGGAYVPIEPNQPPDRAARMMSIADVQLILTTSQTGLAGGAGGRELVHVDRLAQDALEGDDLPSVNTVDSTAYIIFTSGSTGEPKGVEVTHRPLQNLLNWCQRMFQFGPADTGLCVTSLGFDLSVFDILGLLSYGAKLYVADETEQHDPGLLFRILADQKITFWNSAPKTFEHLREFFPESRWDGAALRLAFLSGDYMSVNFPPIFHTVFPRARLINLGGATEATVWSNYYEVGDVDPEWRSIPYGRPIDNSRYYVLDDALEPCRPDEEGDLYIAGNVLSKGYYNRKDLTAERFLPDPWGASEQDRMYATGDRALSWEDGTIIFRGRADRQVKIRGVRIELEEIEHVLRSHPRVGDAVVLVESDPTGDAKLVAHVQAPASVVEDEILTFVRSKLPLTMCPYRVHVAERLPVTVNGKLDRKLLAAGAVANANGSAGKAPGDSLKGKQEIVSEICAILKRLLGHDVDPAADLWRQGVTSFTMVQLSSALRASRGATVQVEWLLDSPTVDGIAAAFLNHLAPTQEPVAAAAPEPVAPAMPTPNVPEKFRVDLFDSVAKAAFLNSGVNLRRDLDRAPAVPFASIPVASQWLRWRTSQRNFLSTLIEARELRHLLGYLMKQNNDDSGRFLYPSAGGTYAVQIHLWCKEGAVAGLAGGYYWLNSQTAELRRIESQSQWQRDDQFIYNRQMFDGCAAAIFLVGESAAIEPLYGEQAAGFLLLEAGYMGQLLMLGQAGTRLGLCPIGSFREEGVRAALRLQPSQNILHSFLVGRVERDGLREKSLAALFVPSEAAEPQPSAMPARAKGTGISVVGHAFRYPGAGSADDFWSFLRAGGCAISGAPERKGIAVPGGVAGAWLEEIEAFDAAAFGIAPSEARLIDPQARLLLETVFHCLESAGHTSESLEHGSERTGVFVGQMWQDYRLVGQDSGGEEEQRIAAPGSELANRISQTFGFTGPSIAVDTACTSGLAAIHLACQAITAGDCDSALVCAVNLLTHPSHLATLDSLGMIARRPPKGIYDGEAAGWAVGEGAGVILLRRSGAFQSEADQIHATIEATHVEHPGSRAHYGSPSREAIARGLRSVLGKAGLAPADIDYVECAASGAAMTDAAEWSAMQSVFSSGARIGSLKANIGHLEAASGMAQLSKVLLQLERGELLPSRVARERSPLIETERGLLTIVEKPAPLDPGKAVHRCLITAIGATSGTAHIIVSRKQPPVFKEEIADGYPAVLLLSAESRAQVEQLARAYQSALPRFNREDWASICATSQLARKSFPYRLAVRADSPKQASDQLQAFCYGQFAEGLESTWSDSAKAGVVSTQIDWCAAVRDWLAGYQVDWRQFWTRIPKRCALPAYPFARRPYWPGGAVAKAGNAEPEREWLGRVCQAYGQAADIPCGTLNPDRPLLEYGVTSRLAAHMAALLKRDYPGCAASPTLLYEHRDLRSMARALAAAEPLVLKPGGAASSARPRAEAGKSIAVIGYSGIFPGCANTDELWTRLLHGDDLIAGPPPHRAVAGDGGSLLQGGFLEDIASFDPFLFGIAPNTAARMDPQERLLLQQAWCALEDAGYPPSRLRDELQGQIGVYVGCMHNEYPLLGLEASTPGRLVDAGGTPGGLANRISYHLDITGPSITLDTMCSSSLTAVQLAVNDLRLGRVRLAIVAACNLSLHPNKYVQQERLRMTSPSSRCKSFAADADGFIPSEGVGAVILRSLEMAEQSHDDIRAVILGVAINHGGKSNGYTVPNPAAQAEIVMAAQRDAGVAPETISYVEAHGTGTVIGDPIEAKGILQALEPSRGGTPLYIGSVKSNIGHLEGAAGLVSMIKVFEQMRHKVLAPSIHAGRLNPDIDWSRLALVREPMEWLPLDDGGKSVWRAGISSFGAGGSNAHIVVEAYPERSSRAVARSADANILIVSAATPGALVENAKALREFLSNRNGQRFDLDSICATLQVGREPLAERWAVVVRDIDQAIAALSSFLAGEPAGSRGRATGRGMQFTDSHDLREIAARWVNGAVVDWRALYREMPRFVRLPAYQFERFRCWIDSVTDGLSLSPGPASPQPKTDAPILVERIWKPCQPSAQKSSPAAQAHIEILGEPRASSALASQLGRMLPAATITDCSASPALDRKTDCLVVLPFPHGSNARAWKSAYQLVLSHVQQADGRPLHVLQIAGEPEPQSGVSSCWSGIKLAAVLQCLATEHPRMTLAYLDIGPWRVESEPGMRNATEKIGECLASGRTGEVSMTALGDSEPVWRKIHAAQATWRPNPDALYVITGGTRGLGAKLAHKLVERGARRLGLIGRTRSAETETLLARLRERGAEPRVLYQPLERIAAVDDWIDTLAADGAPLAGLFHCAGIGAHSRTAMADKPIDDIEAVMAPKIDGLMSLYGLMRRYSPDFVIAFSSISAAMPRVGIGVGDYAAANAAMEYAAERLRRSHGLPVTTIAWPVWESSSADLSARKLMPRHDLPILTDAQGFDFLWQAIDTPSSGRLTVITEKALEQRLSTVHRAMMSPAKPTESVTNIEQTLRKIVSVQIGMPEVYVRTDANFSDLGIESIALAQLVTELEREFRTPLNPSLVLDHPNIGALAKVLSQRRSSIVDVPDAPPRHEAGKLPAQTTTNGSHEGWGKVAVIGLAVRFPGAETNEQFYNLLSEGRCAIREVPGARWDVRSLYDPKGAAGKSVSKWGGFLEGLENFDPDAFGISEPVSRHLDPAIRLILEVSRDCLHDVGLRKEELGAKTGVFIGARMGEYRLRAGHANAEAGLGLDQNFIAAYLAQVLNLRGPNLVVDSACSSSLVSVHLACQSLLSMETEYAFAGGVDVLLDDSVYLQFSKAGALSPSGKCRSFDQSADGFVPGEGAGILLLKRLDKALRDGDPIHAVIEGTAVTNDGTTMGLTTPNPDAHRDAITAALKRAQRNAGEIGMIEAHGTATRIGDPIEFQAFRQAFRASTQATGYCAIGSVKSNIGHLLSAAGIAGLAKAIIAVERNLIPPTLFCDQPNPRFDLADSPFYIAQQNAHWPEGKERVAGVSACGLGGTNAHVIVAQAPPHAPARQRRTPETMNKRRLWLDREAPPQPETLSLLELQFSDAWTNNH